MLLRIPVMVAGAGPCSPAPVVTVAQKRVVRQLGFEERETIDPGAQDKYCKIFRPRVSDSHMQAMTAIFGWELGEGEQVRASNFLTIV
jgi:hypothetical protein